MFGYPFRKFFPAFVMLGQSVFQFIDPSLLVLKHPLQDSNLFEHHFPFSLTHFCCRFGLSAAFPSNLRSRLDCFCDNFCFCANFPNYFGADWTASVACLGFLLTFRLILGSGLSAPSVCKSCSGCAFTVAPLIFGALFGPPHIKREGLLGADMRRRHLQ